MVPSREDGYKKCRKKKCQDSAIRHERKTEKDITGFRAR